MELMHFEGRPTLVCIPADLEECAVLPHTLSCEGKPVITLVGNITTESQEYRQICRTLLEKSVFPLAAHHGIVLLSQGFNLGNSPKDDLPWLIDQVTASFPEVVLIGVNLDCEAALPSKLAAEPWRSQALYENHHAYVLVPGVNQRDACMWRTALASAITASPLKESDRAQTGITLIFGGTAMRWLDVLLAIEAGQYVIAVTHSEGSGVSMGIRDLLAGCAPPQTLMADLNKRLDAESAGMVASGRLMELPGDDTSSLSDLLTSLL